MICPLFLFIFNFSLKPFYYTNYNYYYSITAKDSLIYGATNGGVVKYNHLNDSFQVLTNADGLQTNRQNCIALDSSGFIWTGSEFGLALIDREFKFVRGYPKNLLPSSRIRAIYCLKDTILVGTENGLLFIATNSTPDNFGDDITLRIYESEGLISNNVTALGAGNDFWIGTDEGITKFSKDFLSHSNYTTVQGLLSNHINRIAVFDTQVLVATSSGINIFSNDHFDTLLSGYTVKDIVPVGDSLLLALDSTRQVGIFFQGSLKIIKDSLPYLTRVYDVENLNGMWLCALGNRWSYDYWGNGIGIYNFAKGCWRMKRANCLGSNHICDITANGEGVFVALGNRSSESKGFAWLTNENRWINYTKDSVLPSNQIHRCATAPDGKVWFGINCFGPLDTVQAINLDPITKELYFLRKCYKGMDSAVAIWDLEFDLENNMYLSLAGPSDKIWVIDSGLNNVYFLGDRTPGFEVEMAIDSSGRVYSTVTGAEGGLLMIDTKNTLFNRGDDESYKFGESDGLVSKYAQGCIIDKNNVLYIANESGLTIYDTKSFLGVKNISTGEIFDVELDKEGRVWMMTRTGIYYYDPVYKYHYGWEYNSMGINIEFLPMSNEVIQVQGFEFDPIRECFWLGGETGLLRLDIEYDKKPDLDSIVIYPNPVLKNGPVRIKNLPPDAVVNIYSIGGRAIEKGLKPDLFGEVFWEIPQGVGSGLYFALIDSPDGKRVCKFAIVK
uniref:T9SS type A sorting domain-containing protein n=1 Tax=candidate division WOR-3 bacterium TaxID=2052148 RepID=A0A7C4XM32_UNCW3